MEQRTMVVVAFFAFAVMPGLVCNSKHCASGPPWKQDDAYGERLDAAEAEIKMLQDRVDVLEPVKE